MNQTTGKLTRSAHTAAAGEPFPSLANKFPLRADMLSHRIVFNIPQTDKLMEDPVESRPISSQSRPVRPLNDPDFISAEAALKRASAKAVARDLAAGLERVVRTRPDVQAASSPDEAGGRAPSLV